MGTQTNTLTSIEQETVARVNRAVMADRDADSLLAHAINAAAATSATVPFEGQEWPLCKVLAIIRERADLGK